MDGKELGQIAKRSVVQKIGMVFQDPESQLVMTSVEQEIAFGLENLGLPNGLMKRRVMEVNVALALADYFHSFTPELSGGQKQKVALASVLAMQPEILLLDEPTSQLDPIAGEEILTMIRRLNEENGLTVILIEQRLERCFHLADRVLVMDKGSIISDYHAQEVAQLTVNNNTPFLPPLAKLFAGLGYQEVPTTVKQGRKIVRSYCLFSDSKTPTPEYGTAQKTTTIKRAAEESLLDIQNLWFTYPTGKEALKDINLSVQQGDFIVVMGDNGAGKTTLLKNINGLLKPGRGRVKVLNQDTRKISVEQLSASIGYLSQNPNDYLFLPTVGEELAFTLKNLGLPDDGSSTELLGKLQLIPHVDSNPRDLSTGERQRVALASVLVAKPRLLLLDEPTRGLDYQLKAKLGEILLQLQQEGMAIIIITHDVEFAAEYAEEIVLMTEGTIVARGNKYEMLSGSTFYSPQISKLFHNIADGVVTLEQGKAILSKMSRLNKNQVLSV